ncbi:hypothetical protein STCU_02101 [Strigomonas culicis]|uniref:Uncharacterized protein n=1 Tax=Strigomonas culicis TaxID=28005 RepID=S9WCB3_9TRYP|nr:hypothetical protein STCU_06091 [Strigomonas culicis]EPY33665.1 hypothetical protein STCU_02101 [Strigomonas culicis]|eukprot:EPY26763.1 hypothetical protein STCU_06091 [Strigomonas culicis]
MSTFSDRLVAQMIKRQTRELELEKEKALFDEKVAKQAELNEQLDAAVAKLEKMEQVRESLEAMRKEGEQEYERIRDADAEERKRMSESYRVDLDRLQEETMNLSEREQQARHRNEIFKKQIEVYDSKDSNSTGKVADLLASREQELEQLKTKQANNRKRIPYLEEQIVEEKKLLDAAKEAHDVVKEKVDAYLEQFARVQEELKATKEVYEAANEVKNRQLQVRLSAESDLKSLITRAQTSRGERDNEKVKVMALEEKVQSLKKQIEDLDALTAKSEEKETSA